MNTGETHPHLNDKRPALIFDCSLDRLDRAFEPLHRAKLNEQMNTPRNTVLKEKKDRPYQSRSYSTHIAVVQRASP